MYVALAYLLNSINLRFADYSDTVLFALLFPTRIVIPSTCFCARNLLFLEPMQKQIPPLRKLSVGMTNQFGASQYTQVSINLESDRSPSGCLVRLWPSFQSRLRTYLLCPRQPRCAAILGRGTSGSRVHRRS